MDPRREFTLALWFFLTQEHLQAQLDSRPNLEKRSFHSEDPGPSDLSAESAQIKIQLWKLTTSHSSTSKSLCHLTVGACQSRSQATIED